MKYNLLFTIIVFGFHFVVKAQCKIDYSNYQLVLNEQFDTYSGQVSNLLAGTSIWKSQPDGDIYSGLGNAEYYLSSQLSLVPVGMSSTDYRLRLTADRLQTPQTLPNGRIVQYKSGILHMKDQNLLPQGSFDVVPTCPFANERGFVYGMFEIRCKMPVDNSSTYDVWPAFWLLSTGAELDVFDQTVPNVSSKIYSTINEWNKQPWYPGNLDWVLDAYNSNYPEWNRDAAYSVGDRIKTKWNTAYRTINNVTPMGCGMNIKSDYKNLAQDFHTYTVAWTPNKITMFVDGRELYTIPSTLSKLNTDCPLHIILNLAIDNSANQSKYSMDIEYIKVYKPINNNYSVSFKSTSERLYHGVFSGLNPLPVNVSSMPNSIATNPNNPNEIFYRGVDNYIYAANKINGVWLVKRLEFNDGGQSLAAGDVRYLPQSDMVLYVGANNRINLFGRSTVEPCGFYHWCLSYNWNCYWCDLSDRIYASEGSLQTTANGEVFFKGVDLKLHRYYFAGGVWNHQILPHPVNDEESWVQGDIVIDPATNNVYYKGLDNAIQQFKKGSGNTYTHSWILGGNPSYAVSSRPGSIAWAASQNGLIYIGSDNKIQLYTKSGLVWSHSWIPYTYGNPSLGYPGADFAKGAIAWDNSNTNVLYNGFDGRIQMFGKTGSSWWHTYVDDNWNTYEYNTFSTLENSSYTGSLIFGHDFPNPSIFYTNKSNHLSYFKYESCEYNLPSCQVNSNPIKNIYRIKNNLNGNETDNSLITIFPNPTENSLQLFSSIQLSTDAEIKIYDINGRLVYNDSKYRFGKPVDIRTLTKGLYFVEINIIDQKYFKKIIKN